MFVRSYIGKEYQKMCTNEDIHKVDRLIEKYPNRVPVMCYKNKSTKCEQKFIVPKDLTSAQFLYIMRRRIKIDSKVALFLFINGEIPPSTSTFNDLYEQYSDKNGILHVTYSEENTFGY